MARIEKQDNKLIVPDVLTIPYIEGDGVGVEITSACKKIVEHTINTIYKGKRKIEWLEVLGGEKAYNKPQIERFKAGSALNNLQQ